MTITCLPPLFYLQLFTQQNSRYQFSSWQNTLNMADGSISPKPFENHLLNNIITNASNIDEDGLSPGRKNLRKWLGKAFRVVITDGRVLVGYFNCTDKDANIVLSMCAEFLEEGKDARMLGNVMIPGKHIVSVSVDLPPDEVFAA